MTTVDKDLAFKIISQNGNYGDDPPVLKIYKYINAWGGNAYKLLYKVEETLNPSNYVINPTLIWSRKKEVFTHDTDS
jgi:hypothetical protein